MTTSVGTTAPPLCEFSKRVIIYCSSGDRGTTAATQALGILLRILLLLLRLAEALLLLLLGIGWMLLLLLQSTAGGCGEIREPARSGTRGDGRAILARLLLLARRRPLVTEGWESLQGFERKCSRDINMSIRVVVILVPLSLTYPPRIQQKEMHGAYTK